MFFESEIYFHNFKDKISLSKIHDYNSFFKKGILVCPHVLYYLMMRDYLPEKQKINNIAITRFLNVVRAHIHENPTLIITPHIFTKFIHLLREKKLNKEDYGKVLDLLKDGFNYIKEEGIKKEEIIDFDNFKNQYLGLSDTSLLIVKEQKNYQCVLSLSGKIPRFCGDNSLCVNFHELVSFMGTEEMKGKIN